MPLSLIYFFGVGTGWGFGFGSSPAMRDQFLSAAAFSFGAPPFLF